MAPILRLPKGDGLTIRQQWAKAHAERELKEFFNARVQAPIEGHAPWQGVPSPGPGLPLRLGENDALPVLPAPGEHLSLEHLSLKEQQEEKSTERQTDYRVAIVGAGVAGLFLGLMIDYLNKEVPGFKLIYDIFEANTSDRVGGRLYTYNFKADPEQDNPAGRHDYYDVGGMRFPHNPIMTRVFNLFMHLNMTSNPPEPVPLGKAKNGELIKYTMTNVDDLGQQSEPFRFNDVSAWGSYTNIAAQGPKFDPFNFDDDPKDPQIPATILKQSPSDVVSKTIVNFRKTLEQDDEKGGSKGWQLLMDFDKYTTRGYLSSDQQPRAGAPADPTLPPFNVPTINFLETMNGGTDWYDQALSETVLESLDFDYGEKPGEVDWYCVMGGAQQLPIIMEQQLTRKPRYSNPVTAISVHPTKINGISREMRITVANGKSFAYNGVFATASLGCLRRIDMSGCGLSTGTKIALRTLGYGQSCKVGIKFARPWWIYELPEGQRIHGGGLGHSDLHLRTCVYPSYYNNDPKVTPPNEPAVLLVSYTWQRDAERIAAVMAAEGSDDPAKQLALKELMLRDLAKLHTTTSAAADKLYTLISSLYRSHYAYDWSRDPNTEGAFAFFSAQQFSALWPKIVTPTGNLAIVGEAASPHHAWVVGAIESAVAGLHAWLYSRQDIPGAADAVKFIEKYDPRKEEGNPFLGLPAYFPENTARWLGVVAKVRAEEAERAVKGERPEDGEVKA